MTDDSVPAPMVQLPAETVEKLREAANDPARINVVVAARAVLDAATPAASVPAADILALADATGSAFPYVQVRELRALVAAAEQPDKGEADDTPRDECDHALYTNTHRCTKCGDEVAPAVPVGEPLCRCGHGPDLHHKNGTCFGAYARGCPCTQFDPFSAVMTTDADPRVPVNDEAEAAQLTEALRKKIAVEIETEELTLNAEIGMSSWWVEGMRHAARIAREGRP